MHCAFKLLHVLFGTAIWSGAGNSGGAAAEEGREQFVPVEDNRTERAAAHPHVRGPQGRGAGVPVEEAARG